MANELPPKIPHKSSSRSCSEYGSWEKTVAPSFFDQSGTASIDFSPKKEKVAASAKMQTSVRERTMAF